MDKNNELSTESKNEEIAEKVMKFTHNSIIVHMRFLDMALSRLTHEISYKYHFATDGRKIFYEPNFVLKRYIENSDFIMHDYLHLLFHCIFRHQFVDNKAVDIKLWNLSCDIAVESMINSLEISSLKISLDDRQKKILDILRQNVKVLTAEHIYKYFDESSVSQDYINSLSELFCIDNHNLWYGQKRNSSQNGRKSDSSQDGQEGNSSQDGQESDFSQDSLEEDWKKIAERMQTDMETFSQNQGKNAGNFLQALKVLNHEKYDYAEFLNKFMVMGETMQINDDEFDYIFYTYGLQLYKNMPLIEPLEYKDTKKIREFVIAIDTSGSVRGELVQTFLQKTYNIMMNKQNFFNKINVHIIQCDADIQEDKKITCREEFDEYLKTMKIRGLGGTDFRPVFEYVNQLQAEKEFTNLKGLIYFTDGYGDFPSQKPTYDTAFVFIDNEYNNPDIPPWAIKLVLKKEEI